MSLAIILDVTAEYLRQRNNWSKGQCRVCAGGFPVGESWASPMFIGLDEASTTFGDYRNQRQLQETDAIEVSIWRKSGQFPPDRQGMLIDNNNPYLQTMLLPYDVERAIIGQLHENTEIMAKANERSNSGTASTGSDFCLPLKCLRRAKHRLETIDTGQGGDPIPYVVRSLTFGGMYRLQSVDNLA